MKCFTGDAPRVRSVRSDVPVACDEAIAYALERNPARRCPSARAFADALISGSGGCDAVARDAAGDRSIVVLPFDNLSPDP